MDFTPPFKRVHMYDGLEEVLKCKLPPPNTLHTPGELEGMKEIAGIVYSEDGNASISFFFLLILSESQITDI